MPGMDMSGHDHNMMEGQTATHPAAECDTDNDGDDDDCNREGRPGLVLGLEIFGGLGDSERGITARPSLTPQYLEPNVMLHLKNGVMVGLGGAIGLTPSSQDLFRTSVGYEF